MGKKNNINCEAVSKVFLTTKNTKETQRNTKIISCLTMLCVLCEEPLCPFVVENFDF